MLSNEKNTNLYSSVGVGGMLEFNYTLQIMQGFNKSTVDLNAWAAAVYVNVFCWRAAKEMQQEEGTKGKRNKAKHKDLLGGQQIFFFFPFYIIPRKLPSNWTNS